MASFNNQNPLKNCKNFYQNAVKYSDGAISKKGGVGDGLLSKLRKKYPAACKYINETNHVENDYIFQLDPFKYFSIPQFYMEQLEEFISSEKIA